MRDIRITPVENGYIIYADQKTYVFGNLSSAMSWVKEFYEPTPEDPRKEPDE